MRNPFRAKLFDPDALSRIKEWARACPGIRETASLAVNEIVCLDPACPGTETIILLLEAGRKTRAFKISKSLDDVLEGDVREALSSPEK